MIDFLKEFRYDCLACYTVFSLIRVGRNHNV